MGYKKSFKDGEQLTIWKVIRKMGIGLNISDELKKKVINEIEGSVEVYT